MRSRFSKYKSNLIEFSGFILAVGSKLVEHYRDPDRSSWVVAFDSDGTAMFDLGGSLDSDAYTKFVNKREKSKRKAHPKG